MTEPRPAAKLAILIAPLFGLVLALHAWGDDLGSGFRRWLGRLHYPEHVHGPFLIRAPRSSKDADAFAGRTLDASLRGMLEAQGPALGLSAPAAPITILLLESELDAVRAGLPRQEFPEDEEWVDPARRLLAIRVSPGSLHEREVAAALRRGLARLLLRDAAPSGLSPWLREGLCGLLDGSASAEPAGPDEDPPHLRALIHAHDADFRGQGSGSFRRGARLLVAYLMEKEREAFLKHYRAERAGGPAPEEAFVERFSDPARVDAMWREWRRK